MPDVMIYEKLIADIDDLMKKHRGAPELMYPLDFISEVRSKLQDRVDFLKTGKSKNGVGAMQYRPGKWPKIE